MRFSLRLDAVARTDARTCDEPCRAPEESFDSAASFESDSARLISCVALAALSAEAGGLSFVGAAAGAAAFLEREPGGIISADEPAVSPDSPEPGCGAGDFGSKVLFSLSCCQLSCALC